MWTPTARGCEAGPEMLQATLRVIEHNAATPGLVEFYTVLSAEATDTTHPAHEHFAERYRWVPAAFVSTFDRLRAEGRLATDMSSASLARQLVALMDGLQVQWLYDRSFDMAEELARFLDLILVEGSGTVHAAPR
ncbi:TetR family transcriptional regulator C-terminal domain-containing protein [Cellulomonas dongxiuzhuiae]|uniref:TetR family transcriptional regulator C-terminal domain-containing protein n=1 Tax=Cellulomonas dongxiuzhuiae TaxID=2819979 RepID=UPI001FBAEEAE|nr:TetR family transcriptional regulator C-terminal domain-containing protein [Cellulomonas dongxiuzhuiae]